MPDLCRHERRVCSECVVVTDAARRAYDIIRGYVHFVPFEQRIRSWVALRLADGSSDGNLYESRDDAMRFNSDTRRCYFFSYRTAPQGFANVKEAQNQLDYARMCYDQLGYVPYPDGPDVIMPTTQEQISLQLAQWRRGQNR